MSKILDPNVWDEGRIVMPNAGGGLVLLGNSTLIPYVRTDIADRCIVFHNARVWRNRVTGQITTRNP